MIVNANGTSRLVSRVAVKSLLLARSQQLRKHIDGVHKPEGVLCLEFELFPGWEQLIIVIHKNTGVTLVKNALKISG